MELPVRYELGCQRARGPGSIRPKPYTRFLSLGWKTKFSYPGLVLHLYCFQEEAASNSKCNCSSVASDYCASVGATARPPYIAASRLTPHISRTTLASDSGWRRQSLRAPRRELASRRVPTGARQPRVERRKLEIPIRRP